MNPPGKYLNEHLSGSHAAVNLLTALARADRPDAAIFEGLRVGIMHNRKTLEHLMKLIGIRRARGMELVARLASHVALVRFRSHGLEQCSLGLVEALEALELGVHGQTLLWRGLLQQQGRVPQWEDSDFAALLRSAEGQKATVEGLRTHAVTAAFFTHPSLSDHLGPWPNV